MIRRIALFQCNRKEKNMASPKVSQTIKTTVIGTESSTYEIIKEYTEDKSSSREEAAVIQLYPTMGIGDVGRTIPLRCICRTK